jgi:hypothetical protein
MAAKWKRISKARYWDMLECLPPAVMGGGAFMVGEPMNHNADGFPTFAGFKKVGEAYFEASEPMTIAEFAKLVPGVRSYAYSIESQQAI